MITIPHDQEVLLTRQRHEADRAGLHYDIRMVLGDKAFSWATKKQMPEPGQAIVLWEQPVHTKEYALSEKVVIPKGQYGGGTTYLEWVQKGKVQNPENAKDKFVLKTGDGNRYLFKQVPGFGEKAWLFKGLGKEKEMNKYLEKIAADMKNFAHVRMQNLDNEGGSKVFTARNFKEVKDTNYSRRSGLNRKTDSIHNSPTGTYSGKNVKITKGKSGYRVEVNGNELDVNGRNSPTSYYNPNKKINAEEAFESIKGAGSKAGRTYNPSHLDEIHKGIKSVNRQHNIGQAIKFGKIGLIVGGVGAVGYGAKKLYDNK